MNRAKALRTLSAALRGAPTRQRDWMQLLEAANLALVTPALGRALAQAGAEIPADVAGFISLIEVTPAQSAELEPVTPPPLTEGPHQSYAWQWFAFAAIAVIGLFILIRNDLRDRKRAAERKAAGGATAPATDPQPSQEATHGSRTD